MKQQHLTAIWILAALSVCRLAHAINVEPWRTELRVAPGVRHVGTLKVVNEKAVPVTYEVTFKDISPGARRGTEWIDVDTSDCELAPGETGVIAYTIDLPKAASGEYIGRVGFLERGADGGGAVSVRTKISVPIYVFVAGTERYEAQIETIRIAGTDPVRLEVDVRNTGNAHLRSVGACRVLPADGGEAVQEFALNEQRFPIYPGRVNRLVGQGGVLEAGSYKIHVTLPFPDADHPLTAEADVSVPEE